METYRCLSLYQNCSDLCECYIGIVSVAPVSEGNIHSFQNHVHSVHGAVRMVRFRHSYALLHNDGCIRSHLLWSPGSLRRCQARRNVTSLQNSLRSNFLPVSPKKESSSPVSYPSASCSSSRTHSRSTASLLRPTTKLQKTAVTLRSTRGATVPSP